MECCNRPRRDPVARSTVFPEKPNVAILRVVTRLAPQHRFFWSEAWCAGRAVLSSPLFLDPLHQVRPQFGVARTTDRVSICELSEPHLRQRSMVHVRRTPVNTLVLGMALDTASNVGVKRCGLTL
jgi:hypothetical protein